jgi:FdhD protein
VSSLDPLSLARRPGATVRTRVTEHAATGPRTREDRLATEEPLEIRVAGPGLPARRVWVTMRTPGHDFELAAGFAANESLVSPEDIRQVAYCTDAELDPEQEFNVVTITVAGATDIAPRHPAISAGSSACGVCGKDSVASVLDVRAAGPWRGPIPSPDVVRGLPDALREQQPHFKRTGGVHAAALADDEGRLLVVREDVGRHNAVDKVVGSRILAGQPRSAACLVVSGRAGFELVQKAVASGIGSLVSVGAPTSLSVRLATESGVALFGFTDASRCVQYA